MSGKQKVASSKRFTTQFLTSFYLLPTTATERSV